MRESAARRFACELAYETRRLPTPCCPKAEPARRLTPASLSDAVGEGPAGHAGAAHVGEGIERPGRHGCRDAGQLVEAGHDELAAGAELADHGLHRVLRPGESLGTGELGIRRRAGRPC